MMGFTQLGSSVVTVVTSTLAAPSSPTTLMLGSGTSSTLISRGISSTIDDASVAKELACLFCAQATWITFTVQKLLMVCFTNSKYAFIRGSRALKLPCT